MTETKVLEKRGLEVMTTADLAEEALDERRNLVKVERRIAEVDGKLAESLKVDIKAVLEREFWPGVCNGLDVKIRNGLAIAWVSLNFHCGKNIYYGQVDFLDSWKKYFSKFELGEINLKAFERLLAEKFPGWKLGLDHGGMLETGKPWQRYDKFAMTTDVKNLLKKSMNGGQASGEVPTVEGGVVVCVQESVVSVLDGI